MSVLSESIRPMIQNSITWLYSKSRLGRSRHKGLRILMYHAVGTPIREDVRNIYNISPSLFKAHMRFLYNKYKEFIVPLNEKNINNNSYQIALTFDDGYKDNLTVAAPLLVELGIPFTVFVCTKPVIDKCAGFLTPDDLIQLSKLPGVTIGSHTVNHLPLAECSSQVIYSELYNSKAYLEDLLNLNVNTLSYPHGSVDARVSDIASSIGYTTGATSKFDCNFAEVNNMMLSRTDIWSDDNNTVFAEKLNGDWDWYRWRT